MDLSPSLTQEYTLSLIIRVSKQRMKGPGKTSVWQALLLWKVARIYTLSRPRMSTARDAALPRLAHALSLPRAQGRLTRDVSSSGEGQLDEAGRHS